MTLAPLTRAEIAHQVKALGPWFHNIDLGGVKTAPDHFLGNYPADNWRRFSHALPHDLAGLTVLDIGCNGGFYALEMKRRGAARVVAVDSDEVYLAQARFAARVTGLEIEFKLLSVYDVARLGERFDVVLFMGVLYHLRHPLLALDLISAYAAADLFVFQAMQRGSTDVFRVAPDYEFSETAHFDMPGYPKLHFIEHSYAHDPSNWWAPNSACAQAMLRSAGFMIESNPDPEVFVCRRVTPSPEAHPIHPAIPLRETNR
jgi:tRNA (mo5U34)-methyltransferase